MKKIALTLLAFTILALIGIISYSIPFNNIKRIKQLRTNYPWRVDGQIKWYAFQPVKWVNMAKTPEYCQLAFVVSEDWSFFEHKGYDLEQIETAIMDKIYFDKKLRGASTITQQTAKNLFLSFEKSLARKLEEVLLAGLLEHYHSKEIILETYLNIIEFGEDLWGIADAAKFYFDKDVSGLSPRECSFLAMLLPSPKKHAHSFRKKELTPYAKSIIDQILLKLKVRKALTEAQYQTELLGQYSWESPKQVETVMPIDQEGLSWE
jgi:monofunctional biosynthetic peptidoglycan transglycosylase